MGEDLVHDMHHMAATATCGNAVLIDAIEEDGPDLVAMMGEEARHHADKLGQDLPLVLFPGAEIHRRAEVEQKPGGDIPIFVVDAHMGHLGARGDVPVDMTHIVMGLVFAQVGKIEPAAAEQGAVIPLQEAVQPADHRPFQPPQQRFSLPWRRGHGLAGVVPVPGRHGGSG